MVLAVRRGADLERALVQRLGLAEAALVGVEHAEIVERLRDLGMLGAERRLADLERPPVQGLGLLVAAEHAVELGEVVAALRDVGMIRPERRLAHRQRLAIMRLGGAIAALGVQDVGQIVDAGRAPRIGLGILVAEPQRLAEQRLGLAEPPLVGGAQARLADLVPLVAARLARHGGDGEQDHEQADGHAPGCGRHAPSHPDYL